MIKNKKKYVHTGYGHERAKKALGQNFLINPKVAEQIVVEADISKKDIVLEIGPGTGKLTKYLLAKAKKVIAVEKDNNLFEDLKNKFSVQIQLGVLVLIHGDITQFQIVDYKLRNYKIVANIPYNITGVILKKFLSEKNKPKSMTLMVQKEVAERIIAKNKKESLLSISVKVYGEPKILFKVSRGNFFPSPNVDSVVIIIKYISKKVFTKNNINEEKFWRIVRTGFAHKRKKLSSNLKTLQKNNYKGISFLKTLKNKRAEELTVTNWINVAKILDIDKKS